MLFNSQFLAKLEIIRGANEKTGLDKVEDELRTLAEQMTTVPELHAKKLARTKKDRDELFMENLDLQMKLQVILEKFLVENICFKDALNELEIYRIEPREEARERLLKQHLPKSRSVESLTVSSNANLYFMVKLLFSTLEVLKS